MVKLAAYSKHIFYILVSVVFTAACDNSYLSQANKLSNNVQELQSAFEY